MIDIARAREETPGCWNGVHFNNAGASLPPACVTEVVIAHLRREAEIGGYEAEAEAHEAVAHTYAAAAQLLGCDINEIALVENATRAWDMAFYSLPLSQGDRVLTSIAEYSSNYIALLQRAQQTGAQIEVIPNDASGQLCVESLRAMLDSRVKLIAITHVGTNGGLVNPAVEVGKVAREAGVLYLLDACQSAGQIPLSVQEIGCDMLSATGRKYLRGPRGTGLLYVRRELADTLEPPILDNYAAEWITRDRYIIAPGARRFETWESNVANRIGLGVALTYALGWGLEAIQARIQTLAENLRTRLRSVPGVTVQDLGVVRCGLVTFTVAGHTPSEVKEFLAQRQIHVWVSPLISTRLDMEARALPAVVRASLHYYNTEEEIDRFLTALQGI